MTAQPAEVVSLASRAAFRSDLGSIASAQVAAARSRTGLSREAFAASLGALLGWEPSAGAVREWERAATPPGDVLLACASVTQGSPVLAPPLLSAVPPAFPADALAASWVTVYRFTHAGRPQFHADIARVVAESGSRIRAVNHPPEPRSQGRRQAFRNEVEARLIGRHVVGQWQNVSDTRYFGGLHLAVLPGEMVMEGHYTGVGSDIEVSRDAWKWVRLETADGLADITLRDPAELHDLVMKHSQPDVPLTVADIGENR